MATETTERKLAAILSADVVGYSRLMADDEAATIRTLEAYRGQVSGLVSEHRGRIADFTGDNFLAEFPTALAAVEAAVEIQRVLEARNASRPEDRRMQFRIGIHLGDVATDGERLYGDGVNIAARLEGLAEAAGICISATVRDVVRNKLDLSYEDLGEQSVKNIPGKVRVFRIVARDRARSSGIGEPRIQYAVRADRARTAYAVMGAGPVLVLPPGGSTSLEWYLQDTAAHEIFCRRLAEHRTLVMYDRHGVGLSDRKRTDFTEEDDMLDIEAVVDALGRPTIDLFGISWGGTPALAFAARHPDTVRRMVLYGTGARGRVQPAADDLAREAALRELRRTDRELYTKARASQYFPRGTDRETFQSLARMLFDCMTPEVEQQLEAAAPDGYLDNQSELAGISVPSLVIHRKGDRVALFAWGQYMARRLRSATFLPLEGDAHFPWVDDAESVLRPTIEFLTQEEAG